MKPVKEISSNVKKIGNKENKQVEEEKKGETLDDIGESDEDDDFVDDPMAFVERQDSQQTDMNNLF